MNGLQEVNHCGSLYVAVTRPSVPSHNTFERLQWMLMALTPCTCAAASGQRRQGRHHWGRQAGLARGPGAAQRLDNRLLLGRQHGSSHACGRRDPTLVEDGKRRATAVILQYLRPKSRCNPGVAKPFQRINHCTRRSHVLRACWSSADWVALPAGAGAAGRQAADALRAAPAEAGPRVRQRNADREGRHGDDARRGACVVVPCIMYACCCHCDFLLCIEHRL